MKNKQKNNIPNIFLASCLIVATLFGFDTYISNRLSTNIERTIGSVFFGAVALIPFILGLRKSIQLKLQTWVALNTLAILVIVGWTVWISIILYSFNDFQLVLPD